jgi:hypothetical protein
VRPPRGWEHLAGGPRRVLCLVKALYGLWQALRAWNERLASELRSRECEQSNADFSLWIRKSENGVGVL